MSFASPDRQRAERLRDDLVFRDWKVFLDDRSIPPGSDWMERIARALRASGVVLALLSDHSSSASYQKEELEFARRHELKIVPIYLDGAPDRPADWELGMLTRHRIDLVQTGYARTVEKLGELLLDAASGARSEEAPAQPHTAGELLHGAALRIDRVKQWYPMVKVCRSAESAIFLVHGRRQQNVDLFVQRVWRFLSPESNRFHKVVKAKFREAYSEPRTAAGWENHLRTGLLCGSDRAGTAEDLLRDGLRAHPIFIVLGGRPLGIEDLEEKVVLAALEEFLDDRLPALMKKVSDGRHPVHAMLALRYKDEEAPFVSTLGRSLAAGCRKNDIIYRPLLPLEPLTWDEVKDYLNELTPRPPDHVFERLREIFKNLDSANMEFHEITDLLDRELF